MYGCTLILKLDALAAHVVECEHNPKRPLPCEKGCGFVIPKDEFKVFYIFFTYIFTIKFDMI